MIVLFLSAGYLLTIYLLLALAQHSTKIDPNSLSELD